MAAILNSIFIKWFEWINQLNDQGIPYLLRSKPQVQSDFKMKGDIQVLAHGPLFDVIVVGVVVVGRIRYSHWQVAVLKLMLIPQFIGWQLTGRQAHLFESQYWPLGQPAKGGVQPVCLTQRQVCELWVYPFGQHSGWH